MIKIIIYVLSAAILYLTNSQSILAQQDCENTELFKPLIGEWDGYRIDQSNKTYVGSLSTKLAVNGCAFKQSFTAAQAELKDNYNYESFGFVDETGYWREVYVLSSGDVRHYRWEQNEEELILEQRLTSATDRNRLVIFNIVEDQYQILEERSADRGQTWVENSLIHLIRKQPQAQAD